MLFNSTVFVLAFLPAVLFFWWRPLPTPARLLLLTAASYFFYCWWDWRFAFLMLGTTLVDYVAGRAIAGSAEPRTRKRWLLLSLVYNLGILAFFKYYDFFAASLNDAARVLGVQGGLLHVLHLVLPIGISFYLFESISYTVDIYRGRVRPAESLLHYALFISIFPKLIAGPIIRYADVEEQYRALSARLDPALLQRGIFFFVIGLTKKVLLADRLAAQVDPLFARQAGLGLLDGWGALLGFSLQLYLDFSAYSDMAVGLGLMLGFRFPQNFDRPYLAASISEFWSRWHMTLSRWLRDYLFIPLGGSREGPWKTVRNVLVVMLLGGLWHGASWTFVLWGLYHGLLLGAGHAARAWPGARRLAWPALASRAWVFLLVTLGWLLFRSESLPGAAQHLAALAGMHGWWNDRILENPNKLAATITLGGVWVAFVPEVWSVKLAPRRRWAVLLALLAVVCISQFDRASPFLYYQF
jgi:alginate O-acetyltransferase complex protein AlgI